MNNQPIQRQSSPKKIIIFPSLKNKQVMYCEGGFEPDVCLRLEFDKSILSYRVKPMKISYRHPKGKLSWYTPDIEAIRLSTIETYEIKPQSKLDDPFTKAKLDQVDIALLEAYGRKLTRLSEHQIYHDDAVKNYKMLYPYRSEPIHEDELKRFEDLYSGQKFVISEIRSLLLEQQFRPELLNLLLSQDKITFNHAIRINDNLEVAI